MQYKCQVFRVFRLKCRKNGELPLKSDGFLLKNRRLLCNSRYGECTKEMILEAVFPFTEELVMLVDDSISRGMTLVASSAPGEKGGNIALLDLPLEHEGMEDTCVL